MYVLFHSLYCLLTSLYCNIDISTTLLIVKQYKDIKINSQNTNWKKQSKYQLEKTVNIPTGKKTNNNTNWFGSTMCFIQYINLYTTRI